MRVVAYWVCTVLVALAMGAGGVVDLLRPPMALEGLAHLGYPAYFLLIIGAWKTLSALALLAPGFPLLKEWAYAGVVFDLTGAAASHAAVGDPLPNVLIPLVLTGVTVASWWLRPESRRLPGARLGPAPLAAPAAPPQA